jgi:hypothetical protein
MHSDTEGNLQLDPLFCGVKAYTVDCPWVSVLPATDPLVDSFQLQANTNDIGLVGP